MTHSQTPKWANVTLGPNVPEELSTNPEVAAWLQDVENRLNAEIHERMMEFIVCGATSISIMHERTGG